MNVLFVSGVAADEDIRAEIVRFFGAGSDVMCVSPVEAIRPGLGRFDLVVMRLQTVADSELTGIGLLATHIGCPMICIANGDAPDAFVRKIGPTQFVNVHGSKEKWASHLRRALAKSQTVLV